MVDMLQRPLFTDFLALSELAVESPSPGGLVEAKGRRNGLAITFRGMKIGGATTVFVPDAGCLP